MDLKGKVAVVTGASRGLGLEIAKALGAAGARVAMAVRDPRKVGNGAALVVPCDVRKDADVEAMARQVAKKLGRIDVLVNNAGILHEKHFLEETPGEWEEVLDTNLGGTVRCCRAVGRIMIDQESGCVVNVASVFGQKAVPRLASYGVSKAAILQLTRQLAAEWSRHGVRVNALALGYFATEINAEALGDERLREFILRKIPQRRVAVPAEVGPLVTFLASDDSKYMTGAVLVADGGATAAL